MKITYHYPTAVETIIVDEKKNKVTVENQCYSLTGRNTKMYVKSFSWDEVPADISDKIKKEKQRLEEEKEKNTKNVRRY